MVQQEPEIPAKYIVQSSTPEFFIALKYPVNPIMARYPPPLHANPTTGISRSSILSALSPINFPNDCFCNCFLFLTNAFSCSDKLVPSLYYIHFSIYIRIVFPPARILPNHSVVIKLGKL